MAMYINNFHLLLDKCLLCEVFEGRGLTIKQFRSVCVLQNVMLDFLYHYCLNSFLQSFYYLLEIVVRHQTFLNISCILTDIMSCHNVELTVRITKSKFIIVFLSKNFSQCV